MDKKRLILASTVVLGLVFTVDQSLVVQATEETGKHLKEIVKTEKEQLDFELKNTQKELEKINNEIHVLNKQVEEIRNERDTKENEVFKIELEIEDKNNIEKVLKTREKEKELLKEKIQKDKAILPEKKQSYQNAYQKNEEALQKLLDESKKLQYLNHPEDLKRKMREKQDKIKEFEKNIKEHEEILEIDIANKKTK